MRDWRYGLSTRYMYSTANFDPIFTAILGPIRTLLTSRQACIGGGMVVTHVSAREIVTYESGRTEPAVKVPRVS